MVQSTADLNEQLFNRSEDDEDEVGNGCHSMTPEDIAECNKRWESKAAEKDKVIKTDCGTSYEFLQKLTANAAEGKVTARGLRQSGVGTNLSTHTMSPEIQAITRHGLEATCAKRIAFRGQMFKRLFRLVEDANLPFGYAKGEEFHGFLEKQQIKDFKSELNNEMQRVEKECLETKGDWRRWEGFELDQTNQKHRVCTGMRAWLRARRMHSKAALLKAMKELYEPLNRKNSGKDTGLEIMKTAMLMDEPDRIVDFLNALTIEIADDDWMGTRKFQQVEPMYWYSINIKRTKIVIDPFDGETDRCFDPQTDDIVYDKLGLNNSLDDLHPLDRLELVDHNTTPLKSLNKPLRAKHWCALGTWLGIHSSRTEYQAHWCGVEGLFYGLQNHETQRVLDDPEDPWATRVLVILDHMDSAPSEVLNTPIAQAMIRYHWDLVYYKFWFDRIMDVLSMAAFMCVSYSLHAKWLPRPQLLLFLGVINVHPLFKTFAISWAGGKVYGRVMGTQWRRAILSVWNCVFAFFDFFTPLVLLVWLISEWELGLQSMSNPTGSLEGLNFKGVNHTKWAIQAPLINYGSGAVNNTTEWRDKMTAVAQTVPAQLSCHDFETTYENAVLLYACSFPGKHPVIVVFCIAFRWIYLMLSLMNFEIIGRAILPVWEAACSRDAIVFLSYLFLATIGISHAYFSFPLGDDDSSFGRAFERGARIFWFGDFDMFELEGVDPDVTGTSVNGSVALTENDGADDMRILNGVRIFATFTLFIGPIVFMNTFITVLGNVYSDAKGRVNEHFAKYRINTVKSLLLRRQFNQNVLRPFLCRRRIEKQRSASFGEAHGYWIRIPANCMREVATEDDPVTPEQLDIAKQDIIDQLMENMDKMKKETVEELWQRLKPTEQ